jgi:hypothetical protein
MQQMTVTVNDDTVLKPRLDIRVRRNNGTYTLGLQDKAFELSETTSYIWRQLNGRRTVADVAAALAEHYDIDSAAASADTLEVLRSLVELNLLHEVP